MLSLWLIPGHEKVSLFIQNLTIIRLYTVETDREDGERHGDYIQQTFPSWIQTNINKHPGCPTCIPAMQRKHTKLKASSRLTQSEAVYNPKTKADKFYIDGSPLALRKTRCREIPQSLQWRFVLEFKPKAVKNIKTLTLLWLRPVVV